LFDFYDIFLISFLYYSDGSLPIEEACNVLINNNTSSAPVYDADVKDVSETSIVHARSYVGMFDYGDVIAYILLMLENMTPPNEEEGSGEVNKSEQDTRENLTFEIKDIVRRALEGEEVPVKLASGKVILVLYLYMYCMDLLISYSRPLPKESFLFYSP
jgi:hypothetical protein